VVPFAESSLLAVSDPLRDSGRGRNEEAENKAEQTTPRALLFKFQAVGRSGVSRRFLILEKGSPVL